MRYDIVPLPDIVIANGQTDSGWVNMTDQYGDAREIGIIAPSVLAEAITIVVADGINGGTRTATLESNNVAIKGPLVSAAEFYTIPFPSFRLHAASAVAVAHTFKAFKRVVLGD